MRKVRNPIILLDYDKRDLAKPLEPIVDETNHDLYIRNRDGVTNTSIYESYRQKLMEDGYITNIDMDHITTNTIFGFNIDLNNKESYDSIVYSDDCSSFIPISFDSDGNAEYGSWYKYMEDVFGIRPCILKDGEVIRYLRDDDYTLTDDEVPIDIYSGDLGDVMIEFKHTFYKFEVVNDVLMFRVANYKVDSSYISDAFVEIGSGSSFKDHMYISAYDNVIINNLLRSVSNADIADIIQNSSQDCRNLCNNIGACQIPFAKYLYLLGLTWLFFKNRNISKLINTSLVAKTGTMNKKGLFYSNSECHKILGIENLFSKLLYLEGLILSNGNMYYKPSGEYVSDKRKYIRYPDISFINDGYISEFDSVDNRILIPSMVDGTQDDNFGILNTIKNKDKEIYICANRNNIIFNNEEKAYPRFTYC